MQSSLKAKIHSFESFGTVDGPGIRFIVFMQGCPLRCLYCHNPDSWDPNEEKFEISAADLLQEILKHKNFYSPKGGVTFSGGEPLMQISFLQDMVPLLKQQGIHTAIDTSGYLFNKENEAMRRFFAEEVDLTLLDIKAFDELTYNSLTQAKLQPTLDLMEFLAEHQRPVWIRHVVVPGITDNFERTEALAAYLSRFKNIEYVEVLPFHKMGEFKWKEMNLDYQLRDTPGCSAETADAVREIFRSHRLNTR